MPASGAVPGCWAGAVLSHEAIGCQVSEANGCQAVMEVRRGGGIAELNTIPYTFTVGNCLGWIGAPHPSHGNASQRRHVATSHLTVGVRWECGVQCTAASSGTRGNESCQPSRRPNPKRTYRFSPPPLHIAACSMGPTRIACFCDMVTALREARHFWGSLKPRRFRSPVSSLGQGEG